MTAIATLIASPGKAALDTGLVAAIANTLPRGRLAGWLDPGMAADIQFACTHEPAGLASWTLACKRLIGDALVDVVVQSTSHPRRKKLLIADMDSTMIGQECIDELADFAGVKEHVAAITERAMRGEIAFEPALRERVALLKGLPVSIVGEVIANRLHLMPGGRALVATMRANGARAALVSGGFTLFTGPIAAMLGFDSHQANILEVEEGILTGQVAEPILGRIAKREALENICRVFAISPDATLAVGDGANDLDMLGAASLGIAYRAKPQVALAAHASIVHGDLTALLFAQGYTQAEFVAG